MLFRSQHAFSYQIILHFAAAKLADACGNGFGTKMHVGT